VGEGLARGRHLDHAIGVAPGGAIRGGSACSWWGRAGQQGRVVGRARRGATDARDQGEAGPGVSGGVRKRRKRIEAERRWGTDRQARAA
jgi:hypothetical protein